MSHVPKLLQKFDYITRLNQIPCILVACGSFSPITYAHLAMFKKAKDYLSQRNFHVCAGYISPVSDAYQKKDLAAASHRINMCNLAVQNSDWISVDDWEAKKEGFTPTVDVLKHFSDLHPFKSNLRTFLLAGTDLANTFHDPALWDPKDIDTILSDYGCVVVHRKSAVERNVEKNLSGQNVHYVGSETVCEISSTKVRELLSYNLSVRNLIPDDVIGYIKRNNLYGV